MVKHIFIAGAGLLWSLARQPNDAEQGLRYAMAAGAAAVLTTGTSLSHPDDVARLVTQAQLQACA